MLAYVNLMKVGVGKGDNVATYSAAMTTISCSLPLHNLMFLSQEFPSQLHSMSGTLNLPPHYHTQLLEVRSRRTDFVLQKVILEIKEKY